VTPPGASRAAGRQSVGKASKIQVRACFWKRGRLEDVMDSEREWGRIKRGMKESTF
jgi:hypothetical protein